MCLGVFHVIFCICVLLDQLTNYLPMKRAGEGERFVPRDSASPHTWLTPDYMKG